MASRKPNILFVDDVPEEVAGVAQSCEIGANVRVSHPQDVSNSFLNEADLVLVDFKLEQWAERDNALAVSMKLSAHVADLSGSLPPEHREHAIASTTNVEWVFLKSTPVESLTTQILSLAEAVSELPRNWAFDNRERIQKLLQSLLQIPEDLPWTERILDDVNACHPPVHELSEWSHGVAFLRWLLHKILPYPCFLWDSYYLAARLRVTHESLNRALLGRNEFSSRLETTTYRGILAKFLGQRWWRGGVETLVWDISSGDPFSVTKLQDSLSKLSDGILEPSAEQEPVICLDVNLRPQPTPHAANVAVRLQPDDWPVYADQPWTTIDLARTEPRIAAIVIQQDRDRLNPE